MGTFKKGILGGFSGKVGTVIGSNWRGLDVMRSLPKKSGANPTQQQLEQRQKFALTTSFLSPLTALLSAYFGNASGTSSRLNNAMSYHIKEAITGVSPDFEIDFTKVVISKGEIIAAKDAVMTTPLPSAVQIDWANNSGQVLAEATDTSIVVLFNVDKGQFVVDQGSATRQTSTVSIVLPATFTGDTVHAWLSFVDSAQKKASSSVYLGTAVIS